MEEVNVTSVRYELNNISDNLISDDVIEQQITIVRGFVDATASSASGADKNTAYLTGAAYFSYLAYSNELERVGKTEPAIMAIRLEELKEKWMTAIRIASGLSSGAFDNVGMLPKVVAIDNVMPESNQYRYPD